MTLCAAMVVGALSGCQRYERRRQSLEATAGAWAARLPADVQRSSVPDIPAKPGPVSAFITIEDGARIARASHPMVRIAQAEAAVANAGRTAAGRWPDPQLNGSTRRGVNGNNPV